MPLPFRPIQSSDTASPRDLERYLRETERVIGDLVERVEALTQSNRAMSARGLSVADLELIRRELQSGGVAELDLTNLVGLQSESPDVRFPIVTTAPDPYAAPYDTYVLQSGSNYSLYQIDRSQNPPVAVSLTSSAAPANMMTTDTDQTPGATVVKTWTAAQVFDGGLTSGAQIIVSAGGLNVGAGGIQVVDGGIDVVGPIVFSGTTITSASSPYTIPDDLFVVFVDSSTGAVTVNLTATGLANRHVLIKDSGGTASVNNITVNGNGHDIDGIISRTISTDFESMWMVFDGNNWGIV